MKHCILVSAIVSLVILLSACGQTGPLYLPKKAEQQTVKQKK